MIDLSIGSNESFEHRPVLWKPSNTYNKSVDVETLKIGIRKYYSFIPDSSQIIVVPGASYGLFVILMSLNISSIEIMLPCFPGYFGTLSSASCAARYVDSLGLINDKTKSRNLGYSDLDWKLFNYPNNPMGSSFWPKNEIANLLASKNLIIDVTYANMIQNDFSELNNFVSSPICFGSLSKSLCIAGERVGFVACASDEQFDKIKKFLRNSTLKTSDFSQWLASRTLALHAKKIRLLTAQTNSQNWKVLETAIAQNKKISLVNSEGAFALIERYGCVDLQKEIFKQGVLTLSGRDMKISPKYARINMLAKNDNILKLCSAFTNTT